jgi:hypothetical protein
VLLLSYQINKLKKEQKNKVEQRWTRSRPLRKLIALAP